MKSSPRRAAAAPAGGVGWGRLAAALEGAALVALALAAWVTAFGPIRWKVAGALLVRVGTRWRAWTAAALAAQLAFAKAVNAALGRATAAARGPIEADYTKFLEPNGLRGMRIGVGPRSGRIPEVNALVEQAIKTLRDHGAEVVDPADIETLGKLGDAERVGLDYKELPRDVEPGDAAGVEGPPRELGTPLADRLRGDDADGLADGDQIAGGQVAPVTGAAHAGTGLAGQR